MKLCTFPGCGNGHYAHGVCNSHWKQKRKGNPLTPLRSYRSGSYTLESLLKFAAPEGDCLRWQRSENQYGYGIAQHGGGQWMAHRLAYHLATGEEVTGLVIHHACGNRWCINPEHLARASTAENIAEMLARKDYEAEIAMLRKRVAQLEAELDRERAVVIR